MRVHTFFSGAFPFRHCCAVLTLVYAWASCAFGQNNLSPSLPVSSSARPQERIPRVERAPTMEDFANLEASSAYSAGMGHVENFKERNPTDGAAASQRTDAYLGYDLSNVYIVFLCHDDHANL